MTRLDHHIQEKFHFQRKPERIRLNWPSFEWKVPEISEILSFSDEELKTLRFWKR